MNIELFADNIESSLAEGVNRLGFFPENIKTSLPQAGWGMLGVLIVLASIAVLTFVLNGIFRPRNEDAE